MRNRRHLQKERKEEGGEGLNPFLWGPEVKGTLQRGARPVKLGALQQLLRS